MKNKIKKLLLIIVTFILGLTIISCTNKNDITQNLYQYGIDICIQMETMLKDENYTNIQFGDLEKSFLDNFIANDYDTPNRIYIISVPNQKQIAEGLYKESEDYTKLSNELKKQIENRVSFTNVIYSSNMETIYKQEYPFYDKIRVQYMTAIKEYNGILEKPIAYLYVFESGNPIITYFTQKDQNTVTATGIFYLSSVESLSEVRATLEKYGCTITNY